jgi:acyl carrier protein
VKKDEFLSELAGLMELEESVELTEETDLCGMEQFDSIALLSIIGFADEHFGVTLSAVDLESVTTVRSLMEKIGAERFQD